MNDAGAGFVGLTRVRGIPSVCMAFVAWLTCSPADAPSALRATTSDVERDVLSSPAAPLERSRREARGRIRFQPMLDGARATLVSGTGIDAHVDADRASIRFAAGAFEIAVAHDVEGSLRVEDGAVRVRRSSAVEEWWRALPEGLEHGITVSEPSRGQRLTLPLRVAWPGRVAVAATEVVLHDSDDRVVGGYRGLSALDARGRALPARFVGDATNLRVEVDDRDASYPVIIDPLAWSQQAVLEASDATAQAFLGASAAISSDGQRAVLGATGVGAAYVFVRSGSAWNQVQRLVGLGGSPDTFGASVAIDGTGTRVVVGATSDDSVRGSAHVFALSAGTYTLERRLQAGDGLANDAFGTQVGISEDGLRVIAGAPGDDDPTLGSSVGSAYVFSRSGTSWTQEQKLLTSDRAQYDAVGQAVTISSDGSRVAFGSIDEWDPTGTYLNAGVAYVFVRNGSSWTQEARLTATTPQANAEFGTAMDMSLDGLRLIVGARREDHVSPSALADAGAAYVFARSGSTWSLERRLVTVQAAIGDVFGWSVAMDRTGSRALVGARDEDDFAGGTTTNGAGYTFTRASTVWTEEQKLIASDLASSVEFGTSVSLDGAGTTALLGAPKRFALSRNQAGSGYVFRFLSTTGSSCVTGSECATGFCVDDRCCATSCGGGSMEDCMACASSLTGVADGTCSSLDAAVATNVTCRPSTAPCDAREVCLPGSTTCPADVAAGASTVCRGAMGPCDAEERCDGLTFGCPADVLVARGTSCRDAAGTCDVAEACDGSSVDCPGDSVLPLGAPCRPTMGACDVAESCDGVAAACPTDTFLASGTVCRPAASVCDVAETCDGSSPPCPGDVLATAGTVCRTQDGVCDFAEVCDGAGNCPADAVRPPTYRCGIAATTCDLDDYCDGTTKACPNDVVGNGTPCDDGNVCSLTSNCEGGTCTPSLALDCSDADPCTLDACASPGGCTHAVIPACLLDVGTDATSNSDAGSDSGLVGPVASGGCSCRAASSPSTPWWPLITLVAGGIARSRQRRRARVGRRAAGCPTS